MLGDLADLGPICAQEGVIHCLRRLDLDALFAAGVQLHELVGVISAQKQRL